MCTSRLFGSTTRPVAYDSILLKPGYARLQGVPSRTSGTRDHSNDFHSATLVPDFVIALQRNAAYPSLHPPGERF